jgi:hypothetical protein
VCVAALILAACLAAISSTWYFCFSLAVQAADRAAGYSLRRMTVEAIKETGFYNTPEAPAASPIVHYYDGQETNKDSSSSTARYKVTTTVVSNLTVANSSPVQPQTGALRTITVTVTLTSTGTTVCQTATYLTRSGI